jgi:hypothetical protein
MTPIAVRIRVGNAIEKIASAAGHAHARRARKAKATH